MGAILLLLFIGVPVLEIAVFIEIGQRDAVGDREGRDRGQDASPAVDDQQQGQHEQQVVDAAEDVLDAEHEVAPGDFAAARGRFNREHRPADGQPLHLCAAVEPHDARDDVGYADRIAHDGHLVAHQSAGHVNLPALVPRAADFHHARLARDLGRVRKLHVGRQPGAATQRGDFPEDVIGLVRLLGDLEVGRTENIGAGERRCGQQQQGQKSAHYGRPDGFTPDPDVAPGAVTSSKRTVYRALRDSNRTSLAALRRCAR